MFSPKKGSPFGGGPSGDAPPPTPSQVPPKLFSSGDNNPELPSSTTVATLTNTSSSTPSLAQPTTQIHGNINIKPSHESDDTTLKQSQTLFKRENVASNPFVKISTTTASKVFPPTGLFKSSTTSSKNPPMPSASSLFVPSSSSSFFLSKESSVKPVFSATTLAKTNPNIDHKNVPTPEKVESKPTIYSSSNPFSFKAKNTKTSSASNSKTLFGPSTTNTAYKSSFSSPFSFVRKPESKASTEKQDGAMAKDESGKHVPDKLYSSQIESSSRLSRIKQRIGEAAAVQGTSASSPTEKVSPNKIDVKKYRCILMKGVPKEYNNKIFMKKHLNKYGRIEHVKCNLKKDHTIVYFNKHEAAARAKKYGGKLADNMDPIPIFYTTEGSVRRKSSSDADISPFKASSSLRSSQVDDELLAMGAVPMETPKLIKRRSQTQSSSMESTRVARDKAEPRKTVDHHLDPQQTRKPDKELRKPTTTTSKKSQQPQTTSSSGVASQPKMPPKHDTEPLIALLGTVANSSGERYRVLDARDKLMRMKVTKQSDIATAKAVRGTCPDMCPEKERYSRADKFCLSGFEMRPQENGGQSVMDPRKCLKEYSRSSADQEEPLSHELRPVSVLQMTMDYLLTNIMDHPETAIVGEWYDFIWNRTRAIRKDITQQHLCCLNTVELVEKCARFHIHCSEVLSEEDVMVFDPKINNENLTKCLQTLKHLYADLEEKGVVCPNEAEFRSYEILLNLNESDIASQVQTLREEIRKSSLVIFANHVFQSLSDNNYVRFFALLKKATYLQACITHRYFAQVRTKAMKVILKAYRQPNQVTNQFTIEELLRILAFESVDEATQFCNWLQLRVEGGCISLNKPIGVPDGAAPIFRSYKYIESKRTCSVGEIVNGGPLRENPLNWYLPHDSFDVNGLLKEVAYNAMDQAQKTAVGGKEKSELIEKQTSIFVPQPISFGQTSTPFVPAPAPTTFSLAPMFKPTVVVQQPNEVPPPAPVIRTPSPPPPPALTNEEINEIVEENMTAVFKDTLTSLTKDIARDTIVEFQVHDSATKLLLETTEDILRNVAMETVTELKDAKDRQEYLERVEMVTDLTGHDVIEEVISNESRAVAILVHFQSREEMIKRISDDLMTEILNESMEDNLSILAQEVYREELEWKREIAIFMEKKALQRSKKYFLRWKKVCAQRKTFDFVRRTFPAAAPFALPNYEHLRVTKDPKTILDVSLEECQAKKNIESGLCIKTLSQLLIRQPLNVFETICPTLIRKYDKPPTFIPFKMALVLPEADNESKKHFAEWLSKKYQFQNPEIQIRVENQIIAKSVTYSQSYRNSIFGLSSLIIGNIENYRLFHELTGLSAVTMFFDVNEDTIKNFNEKLSNLLRNKPRFPPIPVAILLINFDKNMHRNLQYDLESIMDKLTDKDLISDYTINNLDFNRNIERFNENLIDTLKWIVEKSINQPVLESEYLHDYLEDGIRKLVLDRVYDDLSSKQKCDGGGGNRYYIQAIDSIVSLYNSVIEHLVNVACNEDLSNHSWPPPEFITRVTCYSTNWNHPEKLRQVKKIIGDLIIDQSCIDDIDSLKQESVFKFVTNVFGKSSRELVVICAEVNDCLVKCSTNYVPWADVFVIVVRHMLDGVNYTDPDEGKEITVHYDVGDYEEFDLPVEWLETTRDSTIEYLEVVDDVSKKGMEQRRPSNWNDEEQQLQAGAINFNLSGELLMLEEVMAKEQEEARLFRKKLEETLRDDELLLGHGETEWLPRSHLSTKHKLSFDDHNLLVENKKHKLELSGYIDDDVIEFSNALKSERKSNDIFRKRLEQILNDN